MNPTAKFLHGARPFQSVVHFIERGIVKAVLSQTLHKTFAKMFDKCQSDSSHFKLNETSICLYRFSVRGQIKGSKVKHVKRDREPSRLPLKSLIRTRNVTRQARRKI